MPTLIAGAVAVVLLYSLLQMVRAANPAVLARAIKIGGGVVGSLEKGSSFVFEQGRVNGEVWLPTYDEVHLGGRFLFLKVKANQIDRYTDYRKFRAETKFTPEPN